MNVLGRTQDTLEIMRSVVVELTGGPATTDDLCHRLGLKVADVGRAMVLLQADGVTRWTGKLVHARCLWELKPESQTGNRGPKPAIQNAKQGVPASCGDV